MNILILDACRNNPLKRSWSRDIGTRGLAKIEQADAPEGSLIAYATAPGTVASDDIKGSNGLYTGALLNHIKTPNQSHNELFQEVRKEVLEKSKKYQNPWEENCLINNFYFIKNTNESS